MFKHLIRVTCEQCGIAVTVNTGDTLKASDLIRRRKWREIGHGYGNVSHVCSEPCEKQLRETLGYPPMKTA